jgi:acetyl/propionyl-CoA carboxylase alpha subunit
MVAKLIVWGESRDVAISRMRRALSEFEIDGVPTTAKFHEAVLRHPSFLAGEFNTGFIEKEAAYFKNKFSEVPEEFADSSALLAALLVTQDQQRSLQASQLSDQQDTPLRTSLWRDRGRAESTHRGGI